MARPKARPARGRVVTQLRVELAGLAMAQAQAPQLVGRWPWTWPICVSQRARRLLVQLADALRDALLLLLGRLQAHGIHGMAPSGRQRSRGRVGLPGGEPSSPTRTDGMPTR